MSDSGDSNSSPISILWQLENLGLTVRIRADGRLGVSPTDLIPPELKSEIGKHRDGIIEALAMRERAERLFGGWPSPLVDEGALPSEDSTDLPGLLAWWDQNKQSLCYPLRLAPGVDLAGWVTMDAWINDTLTGGSRERVAAQLRWIKKAATAVEEGYIE